MTTVKNCRTLDGNAKDLRSCKLLAGNAVFAKTIKKS
jgi:hypothetical protein